MWLPLHKEGGLLLKNPLLPKQNQVRIESSEFAWWVLESKGKDGEATASQLEREGGL